MFKKLLVVTLLCISLISLSYNVSALDLFDYTTYFGNTGEDISVAWDTVPAENPDYITYEVRMKHVERDIYIPITTDNITGTQITFSMPKVGHYIVEARRIRTIPGQAPVYSDWATSVTHGRVDGQSKGWWVYGKLAKPGGIIIGNFLDDIYYTLFILT